MREDEIQHHLQVLEESLQTLNSTPIGRKYFLASLPMLLAACGSSREKTRFKEGDNTGQDTDITVEDEKQMTNEVLPKMIKDYPPIEDSNYQNYISQLGQKIVRANDLHNKPYSYNFTVVGVNYVNAFALPAGTVFVTAPLIAMAESEAELAGVIGHEIGHIKARHTAERMYKQKQEEKSIWKYMGVGSAIGAVAGAGLGAAVLCKNKKGKDYNKCMATATAAGAAVGTVGGLLVQKYAFMQNSQEDEMEADRVGYKLSVNAGYSKVYVGKFYEKLYSMEQEHKKTKNPLVSSITDAMSTHPPSEKRVEQMNELVAETKLNSGEVSSHDFDRVKKLSEDWTKRHKYRS